MRNLIVFPWIIYERLNVHKMTPSFTIFVKKVINWGKGVENIVYQFECICVHRACHQCFQTKVINTNYSYYFYFSVYIRNDTFVWNYLHCGNSDLNKVWISRLFCLWLTARGTGGRECMQSMSNAYILPNRSFKKMVHFRDLKF